VGVSTPVGTPPDLSDDEIEPETIKNFYCKCGKEIKKILKFIKFKNIINSKYIYI
jgi:hypothetical protein